MGFILGVSCFNTNLLILMHYAHFGLSKADFCNW